ncbi:hypothetical protein BKA62DRAFT_691845, partial [Auriculariales sp. MPI-PUGE-AT-0066]
MVRRGSDEIPLEIWFAIANYLGVADIRQLATLCRPFASLAYDSFIEQRRTLVLAIRRPYQDRLAYRTLTEPRRVAHAIAGRFQARIQSGLASQTTRIVFCSHEIACTLPLRFVPDSLGALLTLMNQVIYTNRLPTMYKKFTSVESLVILHRSYYDHWYPRCLSHTKIFSMWTSFSVNLRELSILFDCLANFQYMAPRPKQRFTLPRLEVMRLAYRHLGYNGEGTSGFTEVQGLVQLYATSPLHTLDLRLGSGSTMAVVEILLPLNHVYPCLRTFSLVATNSEHITPDTVVSFIEAHASTLRRIAIHRLPMILYSLIRRMAAGSSSFAPWHRTMQHGQIPVALSVLVSTNTEFFQATASSATHSLEVLRGMILEYQPTTERSPAILKVALSVFPNLRRVCLVANRTATPATWNNIARCAPRLVSFSLHINSSQDPGILGWPASAKECDDQTCTALNKVLHSRAAGSSRPEDLRRWQLKDLSIFYGRDQMDAAQPSWLAMRHIANIVPSIESFLGRGHMKEDVVPAWRDGWVWNHNAYFDQVVDAMLV